MATLNVGVPRSLFLSVGQVLDIAVPAGGTVDVSQALQDGTVQTVTLQAGQTLYGPFAYKAAFKMTAAGMPADEFRYVSERPVGSGGGSNYSDAQALAAAQAGIPASAMGLGDVRSASNQGVWSGRSTVFPKYNGSGRSPAGRSQQMIVGAKATEFEGVQLTAMNSQDTPLYIRISVAACPYAMCNKSGLNAGGTNLNWIPLTFGGASYATVPGRASGSGTVVAPNFLNSDYLRLLSVPRTDVPGGPALLAVRVTDAVTGQTLSGIETLSIENENYLDAADITAGMVWSCANETSVADGCTDPTTKPMRSEGGGGRVFPAVAVTFTHPKTKTGASMFLSTASQANDSSWASLFMRELQKYKPEATLANFAIGSTPVDYSSAIIRQAGALILPDVILMFNSSVNGPSDQNAQYDIVKADILWANSMGIKVVLMIRWDFNELRIRALRELSKLCTIVDVAQDITDNTRKLLVPQYSSESVHVNMDGKKVYVPQVARAVAALIR